ISVYFDQGGVTAADLEDHVIARIADRGRPSSLEAALEWAIEVAECSAREPVAQQLLVPDVGEYQFPLDLGRGDPIDPPEASIRSRNGPTGFRGCPCTTNQRCEGEKQERQDSH